MSEPCVFCGIVDGSEPHSVVAQDERTIAFMSIRQQREGHVLVIPRRHIEDIFGLDDATGAAVMAMTARIARAVEAAFQPEGLHLWQSNGPAANQEVPHFHMHVMPRWHGDGLLAWHPTQGPIYPDREELDRQAALIEGFVSMPERGDR